MYLKLNLFPSYSVGVEDNLLGSLRAKLSYWSRVGVSHLLTRGWKEIQCLKRCVL
jgi:hypothetical protein